MDVIIAARLSQKQRDGQDGIGIETQDARSHDFCARNDHAVVATVADTRSGTTAPKDRPNLRKWVTDPKLIDKYQGIVAYKTDRLSRGTDADFSHIESWASTHNKTLIIVNDLDGIHFPSRGDSDYWQWTATKREARREWEAIKERSGRAQTQIKANNGLVGKAAWGYDIVGERYSKAIAPNDFGRKYIPEIFNRCINGDSLETIAVWLTDAGVPTPYGKPVWHRMTVRAILNNPTYCGRRCAVDKATRTYGKTLMRCESVVSAKTFKLANQALSNRVGVKRGPRVDNRAMLASSLFCFRCNSPMYRIRPKDGFAYYRCNGRTVNGQRKGCGNMIPLPVLDAMVNARMARMTKLITEIEIIPADDHSDALAEIRMDLRELNNRLDAGEIDDDEYDTQAAALRAERDRIKLLPVTPEERTEKVTDKSYADVWASLDDNLRGQWLRDAGIKIWALKGSQDDVDAIAEKSGMFGPEDAPPEVVNGVALYMPGLLFRAAKATPTNSGEE